MADKQDSEQYPLHVVCAWIGNTQPVAAKHDLQVTDAHFDQAAAPDALQSALQQPAVPPSTAMHEQDGPDPKLATDQEIRNKAIQCEGTGSPGMGDTGLEPVTSRV